MATPAHLWAAAAPLSMAVGGAPPPPLAVSWLLLVPLLLLPVAAVGALPQAGVVAPTRCLPMTGQRGQVAAPQVPAQVPAVAAQRVAAPVGAAQLPPARLPQGCPTRPMLHCRCRRRRAAGQRRLGPHGAAL